MAWHGSQSSLRRDPYDCDFGVGFWGHATGSSAFVVGNLTLAAQGGGASGGGGGGGAGYISDVSLSCYLCNVKVATTGSAAVTVTANENGAQQPQAAALLVVVTPTDSFHQRVYFGALGLDLQLDAGQFDTLTLDLTQRTITAALITTNTHMPGGRGEGEDDEDRGRGGGNWTTQNGATTQQLRDGLRAGPLLPPRGRLVVETPGAEWSSSFLSSVFFFRRKDYHLTGQGSERNVLFESFF
eukprot:COSAG06_NODE_599_length_13905_cov_347.954657_8_plen_241_part_00